MPSGDLDQPIPTLPRCGCSLVAGTAEQKYEKDGYAQNGHSSTASN